MNNNDNEPIMSSEIKKDVENQILLDDLGRSLGFETAQARSIRILNKIFEELYKEIEKEEVE